MKVLFTFDVEEWFHPFFGSEQSQPEIWNELESEFPIMIKDLISVINQLEGKCIVFVVGWLAQKYPKEILSLAETGAIIGSHGYFHTPANRQTEDEFDHDLSQSKFALESALGMKVNLYRAPGFSITRSNYHLLDNILSTGFIVDSSLVSNKGVRIPCGLTELPTVGLQILNLRLPISGGLFFRLLPITIFCFINRIFIGNGILNFYIHTWEITTGRQASMGKVKSLLQYGNIKSTRNKLLRFIEDSDIIDPRITM